MGIFQKLQNARERDVFHMVVDVGNGFYAWNGNLYQSDIVRACIRPKTKAIGKLIAKHIRETETDGARKIDVNPLVNIRFLLEEPNQYMTGQMLQEKVANQLALNHNAFILILRDAFGVPCGLYPIPAVTVEARYDKQELYLRFYFQNGKNAVFPYSEVIHIREDYSENDLFGDPPGKALADLMNIVTTSDQGIVNAIKNGAAIRWLLKFTQSLRPEDLKGRAKEFAENFLSMKTQSFGVAATDAKGEAKQIQPNDFVPNAAQSDRTVERVYAFFNTNKKIVTSSYTEDEWISYYESCIEPIACQMAGEYTRKLFTRTQRSYGNKIMFEASNLTFASMTTKLNLVLFVDRGIMTPNEVRYYLNLAPVDGGDVLVRRLDTAKVSESDTDQKEGSE